MRQIDFAIFDLLEQTQRFQIGDDLLAGLLDRQPLVVAGVVVERAIGVQDVDHRQLLPLADFVVVGIVGRRDLDAAAAQLGLGPFVGHQRNLAIQQRQHHLAAGQGHVAQLDQAAASMRACDARPMRRAALERSAFSLAAASASFCCSSASALSSAAAGSG